MGQKTHPIGFRLGTHRKWASSWYNNEKSFFINKQESFLSKGLINPRGAHYSTEMEEFIEKLRKRKMSTNFTKRPKFRPVDFCIYKGVSGYTYGFFIYTKLVSHSKRKN